MGCFPSQSTREQGEVTSSDTDFSDDSERTKMKQYLRSKGKKYRKLLRSLEEKQNDGEDTHAVTTSDEEETPGGRKTEELKTIWWGLGTEKWREAIDGFHSEHGRFTFDLCLHKLNAGLKEIGYLSSMYDAWCVAETHLGEPVTVDLWLSLHSAAMGHPGNEFIRNFRCRKQGNMQCVIKSFPGSENGMTSQAINEYNTLPKRLATIKPNSDSRFQYLRHTPGLKRKRMRRYFERFTLEFYSEIEGVVPCMPSELLKRQAALHSIVRYMQKVTRMEPCRDGNTRTAVVLTNKLLVEHSFHPAIFVWPDAIPLISHNQCIGMFRESMTEWERRLQKAESDWNVGKKPERKEFECPEAPPPNQSNAYFSD